MYNTTFLNVTFSAVVYKCASISYTLYKATGFNTNTLTTKPTFVTYDTTYMYVYISTSD
jgi:hypothetical protein